MRITLNKIVITIIFFVFSFQATSEEVYLNCELDFLRFVDNINHSNDFSTINIKDVSPIYHNGWVVLDVENMKIQQSFSMFRGEGNLTITDLEIIWSQNYNEFEELISIQRITGNLSYSDKNITKMTESNYTYTCEVLKEKKF